MSLYVAGLVTIGDAIEAVTDAGSPAENSGAQFENDVFQMRAYCWCGEDTCAYCAPCTCPEDAWRYYLNGREVPAEVAYAGDWIADGSIRRSVRVEEKACPVCRGDVTGEPNFRHLGTGFEVWWYKYAGRGMRVNRDLTSLEWLRVQVECIRSVLKPGRRVPGEVGRVLDLGDVLGPELQQARQEARERALDAAQEAVERASSLFQPLGAALAAIDALREEQAAPPPLPPSVGVPSKPMWPLREEQKAAHTPPSW